MTVNPSTETSATQRRSKKRRRKVTPKWEDFAFTIKDWSLRYSLSLQLDSPKHAVQEFCVEHHGIVLEGPLLGPIKRKVERVTLDVHGQDYCPKEWGKSQTAIGAVLSVREGVLSALVWIPSASFPTLLLGLHSQRVRAVEFLVFNLMRGSGTIRRFSTVDPEEYGSEELGPPTP